MELEGYFKTIEHTSGTDWKTYEKRWLCQLEHLCNKILLESRTKKIIKLLKMKENERI